MPSGQPTKYRPRMASPPAALLLAWLAMSCHAAPLPAATDPAHDTAYDQARAQLAAAANTGGIATSAPGAGVSAAGAGAESAAIAAAEVPCALSGAAGLCSRRDAVVGRFYSETRACGTCFYRCVCNGACPAVYHCGPGLRFNEEQQVCDWAYNLPRCQLKPSPPLPPRPPRPPPSPRPPRSPPPSPPYPPLPPGSRFRFAGYYESWQDPWAGTAARSALASLPPYIDILCLSFMQPDASYKGGVTWEGTGLSFSSDPAVVKGAIALLKRRSPRTRVLISVGGATYPNWDQLNAPAVAKFVQTFGLDGVDVDYEGDANCWKQGRRMRCTSDAGYIKAVQALRRVLPRPRYLVTTAAWSIGAYGEGRFANSLPQGAHTGMALNMLRRAGRQLDYVFVMSYDAGSKRDPEGGPTGYDVKEAIEAYCSYFPCRRVLAGMQVPPEAWGDAQISPAEAEDLGRWVARRGAGGLMLWALTKSGTPSAAQLAGVGCRSLNGAGCHQPLRIR